MSMLALAKLLYRKEPVLFVLQVIEVNVPKLTFAMFLQTAGAFSAAAKTLDIKGRNDYEEPL